ncbi:MAG TPA: HYR domain-containing protein [Pyrinomonadaceae bacterium]|nr:HYR domain-containing protein [Pyrinomonadaceae bacterium]
MNTGIAPQRFLTRLNFSILAGVFIILAAVVAVPFYTARSSSLPTRDYSQPGAKSAASNPRVAPSSIFLPLSPEPLPFIQSIATFDSATCSIPTTDFQVNQDVCAKATGVPVSLFPSFVAWVDPAGLIAQLDIASTDDQTQYHFTPTTTGPWRVNLLRSNGAVRQTASFTVHDTNNVNADVFVQKFVHSASASVAAGDDISFTVVVGNAGPDSAVAVHLIDAVPGGLSFVSFTQQSGPTCVPTVVGVNNDCSIATMANGDRAEFTAIYNTATAALGDYVTSATASSTTADPNTANNTGTAQFTITTAPSTASCQIVCPDNINAVANTTEGGQRGVHVAYDDPTSTGACGSVSSTPVSGSFFPVGTTVVTATSETGGGSCTFVIIVDDTGTNPPTISCPANQTVNADNSCLATVNLGTPTTGGDNVTVHVTRSDGLAMYDCDVNGNNCVRKTTDLPFTTGVTSVVWMATAHDNVGNVLGTASCTQTITVVDVTPPTITAANQTASADANCVAPVPNFTTTATVSDNCASPQDIRVTQDVAPGTLVGLGPHTIHLTANDGSSNNNDAGNSTTISVTFTVNDTTPPVITCPANIADVPTEPGICAAHVDPGTATATDNCDANPVITAVRSDHAALTATYPRGTTTITWTATDASGNHSSCDQTITVVDKEPPVIVLNGQTPSMWPPNHKYQTFGVTNFVTAVTDNCDTINVSSVVITKVTSDEIENGNGDGNTLNDIIIASDCKSVQLRSEREGNSNGRVYTIYFKVSDTSGNVGTATAKVVVQHNPGETAVDSGPHYTVISNCP